jgi:hypothetical protein
MCLAGHRAATAFRVVFVVFLSSVTAFSATVAEGEAKAPTFAKDIAPILQSKCQDCHHAGGSGPMSLLNYDEVRPWPKAASFGENW